MMTTILITGGTGLVGKLLAEKLIVKNYTVRVLTRTPKKENEFSWDIANNFIDEKAFDNLDYIIHLAGAGIADKRWTSKRKKEIIDSRTQSTQLLLDKVKELKVPLRSFISASAVGYYGAITSGKIFTERDVSANDFLGTVCNLWEKAVLEFDKIAIPTTIFRLGIVLSKKGGALEKMKTPIITPIANGKQYIPCIDIEDLTDMFIFAIEKNLTGIFNAVAPEEQTSYGFSKLLAKKTKRPFVPIGVPTFLLKLIFGEMSILLTTGSRVSSKKIIETGFQFTHKKLESSLNNLT
ncbi:Epimerase family protein [Polaribacter huanghezhanensis]|uniref:TIGR01777 family oxidoreductase n=1 Tax=Polaribacter huanghezhanensis TaxID=1354726 RepID=UPI00264903B0|nr:TIGR01777 family oxidoreductase [Polaribacter huanghezhanensis]WKD84786.1 Epimerase family protein [Polaribacter huanghezhanensis]